MSKELIISKLRRQTVLPRLDYDWSVGFSLFFLLSSCVFLFLLISVLFLFILLFFFPFLFYLLRTSICLELHKQTSLNG